MPSPLPSEKLRTKTSYQTRSFQSFASGVVDGLHAIDGEPAALAGAVDGGGAADDGAAVLLSEDVAQAATSSPTRARRPKRDGVIPTAEVYGPATGPTRGADRG